MPSSPLSLMAPAWGFASAGQSLSRMGAACGPLAPPGAAQLFSSPCPPQSRPMCNSPTKQYAVILYQGEEAFSGLLEFAEKYQVTSACFHRYRSNELSGGWMADPHCKCPRKFPPTVSLK